MKKKQPELPDLIRDMEIVQSLNRMTTSVNDLVKGREVEGASDVSDGATS